MKLNSSVAVFMSLAISSGCTLQNKEVQRPNILFCIADDAGLHMGAYGSHFAKTPAFDRVANQGVLFSNAFTCNAKCAPSRSCIVTGRNSWQLEEAGNHWSYFPTKFKTFNETLDDFGYQVGYTAKGVAPVVALNEDGSKRHLTGKAYNKVKCTPPTKNMAGIDYAANFSDFLNDKKEGEPFCFWYGGFEPHRGYEYGSGVVKGKKNINDIYNVYSFWPDKETVRQDLLDYAFELEYFDKHLGRMIAELEKRDLLENTIIVVTSDNGMPFPRVKGQAYEYSNHLPLAIMWPKGIEKPGRKVDDFVSFIDFAPTFLELAGVSEKESGMKSIQGKSLTDILYAKSDGTVTTYRDHVLIGKERHDVGRPHDQGYPIRGIRKDVFLFVRNFKTDRWPSGNPETGYLNCDGGATKSQILSDRRKKGKDKYWDLCFGKRAERELYNVKKDPECMFNLINDKAYTDVALQLETQLVAELKQQKDPRIFGNGDVFDEYKYSCKPDCDFYDRFKSGKSVKAGWVSLSDFETPEELEIIYKNTKK